MQKGILLNTLDTELKTVNNAIIQLGDIDDTGKGRHFVSKFIQDGLVKIEGHGIVLLKKETIDQSLQSMVGAPVIIKHQDVTNENADELRCGVISKAYFNDFDGWYYCEGIIWDEKAKELVNKGWSVSCSYDFLAYNDEGGVENNIKYDKEFTQLNFTHLAIVNNPRYERANIVFNSKLIDNARGFDGSEGQWVTIKGTHVFIPDGKTLDDVIEAKEWSKKSDKSEKQTDTKDSKETRKDLAEEIYEPSKYKPETITDKIKSFEDKIPKNYRRDEQTKALWLYKNNYITRSEWEKFRIDNSKENDMKILDELKKLISKVENEKGEQDMDEKEKVDNENVDKRKLIDEVAGIMKSAGCDDEDIRTAIGKMEKIGYDKSEAGSADNKKVKNEEPDKKEDKEVDNEDAEDKKEADDLKEDAKEDIENKCKNSKSNTFSFDKINEIYNSVKQIAQESDYVTRQQKLDNAVEYFK